MRVAQSTLVFFFFFNQLAVVMVVVVCCNGGGSQWFSSTMFCDFEVLKSDFFFLNSVFTQNGGKLIIQNISNTRAMHI
jgi:hypothetical protein